MIPQSDFDDSKSDDWVFLTSCTDDQEASMIESFLASENIFVLRKYEGAGDYLRIACGTTIFGIDLFVKKRKFKDAKVVLDEVIGTMDLDKDDAKLAPRTTKSSIGVVQNQGKKRLLLVTSIALIIVFASLIMTIVQQKVF